jgi:hypothetical protein
MAVLDRDPLRFLRLRQTPQVADRADPPDRIAAMGSPGILEPVATRPAATRVVWPIFVSRVMASRSCSRRLSVSGRGGVVFGRGPLPALAQL